MQHFDKEACLTGQRICSLAELSIKHALLAGAFMSRGGSEEKMTLIPNKPFPCVLRSGLWYCWVTSGCLSWCFLAQHWVHKPARIFPSSLICASCTVLYYSAGNVLTRRSLPVQGSWVSNSTSILVLLVSSRMHRAFPAHPIRWQYSLFLCAAPEDDGRWAWCFSLPGGS